MVKLPHYMMPSTFIFLESLPLTNGKVNRQALPLPDNNRPELAEAFVAPRTQVEQALADIWAEVLNRKQIGIHDNFFELGGDSIRIIQILARANQAGLRLTPKEMFEHQTIAEQATLIRTAAAGRSEQDTLTVVAQRRSSQVRYPTPTDFPLAKLDQQQLDRIVNRLGRLKGTSYQTCAEQIEDIYPLSPAQWGMLFYSLCHPPDWGVYHHQFCYSLRGDLDVRLFERSWQTMAERHSILRTAFLTAPVQIVKRHANLPLDYRDWRGFSSGEQEERLEEFLKADRQCRFEISEPPLIRLALFRLSETHYQFVRTFHHVILDGWSSSILWKEVLACYEALSRGREPEWKPAAPFRGYIAWLQQQEQKNSEAETFWRTLLRDFTPPSTGPNAASSSREHEKRHELLKIQFSRGETARLQAFAREHRLTMNSLAQATWALLLSRYSGKSDILFGGVLSVRPSAIPGVESMVGPLINVLPIRVQLTAEDSVRAFLRKLHRRQVEIRQYDYSSLAKVHEWSGVPRRTSLFDSLFLFQNYPESPVRERGDRFEIRLDRVFGRSISPLATVVRPGSELSLAIRSNSDRLDAGTVKRMLDDFQALLRDMIADPDQRVFALVKASAPSQLAATAEP
jgi:aryl carrier-like protein